MDVIKKKDGIKYGIQHLVQPIAFIGLTESLCVFRRLKVKLKIKLVFARYWPY